MGYNTQKPPWKLIEASSCAVTNSNQTASERVRNMNGRTTTTTTTKTYYWKVCAIFFFVVTILQRLRYTTEYDTYRSLHNADSVQEKPKTPDNSIALIEQQQEEVEILALSLLQQEEEEEAEDGFSINGTTTSRDRSGSRGDRRSSSNSSTGTTCKGFVTYPFPDHHSGLPYLSDAFASHDATKTTFVGITRGKCDEQWKTADSFGSYTETEYHRFLCVYHDASSSTTINSGGIREMVLNSNDHFTSTNNNHNNSSSHHQDRIYVLSDYVYSGVPHDDVYMIQCMIPEQFRHHIKIGQTTTNLYVDIYSLEDLEASKYVDEDYYNKVVRQNTSSIVLDNGPRIQNIPLCHPASVYENGNSSKNKNKKTHKLLYQPDQYKLVAYAPIKSYYDTHSRLDNINTTLWSSYERIPEWIEYHYEQQLFDHFIIYDNDPEPNGPIYRKLVPYINIGIVSYLHYPLKNCMSLIEERRMDAAQITGSMSALHRLGYTSKYFAYLDGDEFFVPIKKELYDGVNNTSTRRKNNNNNSNNNNKTKSSSTTMSVLALADSIFKRRKQLDYISWTPSVMSPCNNTQVTGGGPITSKWNCRTTWNYADVKLIVRTETVFYFCIHYAVLTNWGTKPIGYNLNDQKEGFLAHFRVEDDPEGQNRDTYEGTIRNDETNRIHYFDKFQKTKRQIAARKRTTTIKRT